MKSNLDKLKEIATGESQWLSEAKKREKYSAWYDLKFYLALKWIMFKNLFK